MRFLRIKLENWMNFRVADTKLERRAFVVGPNASGKSNLLDAFRFLGEVANRGLAGAVSKRGGLKKIRCLAARRKTDVIIEVEIGESPDHSEWAYRLAFTQDSKLRPIIKEERIEHRGKVIIERPNSRDSKDSELLTQTHLEQVYANKRFRSLAEFLTTTKYLHIVPQLVREPGRSAGIPDDPYGGDFLERVFKTDHRIRDARLSNIQKVLKIAIPQLMELKIERDPQNGVVHLLGRAEHWRERGAWQTENQFSDGSLRLMGLLWSLLDGSGPMLLEEPELSLHTGVIKYIPQMLARLSRKRSRQLIISTHSSDLLTDEGISPSEVVMLLPDQNGTVVCQASDIEDVVQLLNAGFTIAEAILTRTAPVNANQLLIFGDA